MDNTSIKVYKNTKNRLKKSKNQTLKLLGLPQSVNMDWYINWLLDQVSKKDS